MIAIGEASRQSGVGIETIRFYEREGVVPKPARGANNRRLYSAEAVGRLRYLKRCRDLGFSLADAKTLLALSDSRQEDCQSVRDLAQDRLSEVRAKLEDLSKLESALVELMANCAIGNVACPMLSRLRAG